MRLPLCIAVLPLLALLFALLHLNARTMVMQLMLQQSALHMVCDMCCFVLASCPCNQHDCLFLVRLSSAGMHA